MISFSVNSVQGPALHYPTGGRHDPSVNTIEAIITTPKTTMDVMFKSEVLRTFHKNAKDCELKHVNCYTNYLVDKYYMHSIANHRKIREDFCQKIVNSYRRRAAVCCDDCQEFEGRDVSALHAATMAPDAENLSA